MRFRSRYGVARCRSSPAKRATTAGLLKSIAARPHTRMSAEKEDEDFAWLEGAEPYLYAQMLPLEVAGPEELIGRRYTFPQSPDDDPPDWEAARQWPFFCLYTCEHDYAYPMTIAFLAKRDQHYRVEISGKVPLHKEFDLRVKTWLRWEQ